MLVSLLIAGLSWRYLELPLQQRFRPRLERVRLAENAPAIRASAAQPRYGGSRTGSDETELPRNGLRPVP
jgi:peptidoglycan/LPS O-acetylase OafA/YrhL